MAALVSIGSVTPGPATAQPNIPCDQWQQMHPGWPCIPTPPVPPYTPPQPTPPLLPTPVVPVNPQAPGGYTGGNAGALPLPNPQAPRPGDPIVPVPGHTSPMPPGNTPPTALPPAVAPPWSQVPSAPGLLPPSPELPLPVRTEARHDNLSAGRAQALDYAARWASSHNPDYPYYGESGGDCTNFVSQVMRAGGFADEGPDFSDFRGGDSDDWYFNTDKNLARDYSTTWALAKENHNYITQHSGRGKIVGIAPLKSTDGLDPLAATHAGLVPGDLIYYKDRGGAINHVAVYMGQKEINGVMTDVVNQHSTKRLVDAAWMPEPDGNYVGGSAQAEFVHLTYPGE